jgi:hypothetical protein
MLTAAFVMLALAFGFGKLIRLTAKPSHRWLIAGTISLLPGAVIVLGMLFATQMLAWGLLILLPGAVTWFAGCVAGAALSTQTARKVR